MFQSSEEVDIAIVKERIRSKLKTKLDALPLNLRQVVEKGILSGGVSASLFHNEMPNDWDVYLKTKEDVAEFNKLINGGLIDYVEDVNPKYMVTDTMVDGKVITARATTLKQSVQVITMETIEHRKRFDFLHCMPWYDIENDKFYISENQYRAIKQKRLVINPEAKEVATYRIQKFENRGWRKL
jgi:hypothetical protein